MTCHWKEDVLKLYASLDLTRKAVGVKLIETEAEFQSTEAVFPQKPIRYCQMVKGASAGHSIKAKAGSFSCQSGPRVLGIDPADEKNAHGENWARLGLYSSRELSEQVRAGLSYSQQPMYGVLVQPLEKYEEAPDVAVIITNPYNIMRITQGYAYSYGMPGNINMLGNQAVCLECSARPYVTQDMNISLLCIGTRHLAGWGKDEMAAGIPALKFSKVIDGIYQTINIMEDDENKKRIAKNFAEHGIPFDVRYQYNYYKDC
ncbi:DUF169 domain-containing protein [Lacrimispora sp.]|uniref:DUF169 domain-containing protein n=1 Tax=Lacrimispora sp. TaxID=2719234 RepID=UPI0028B23A43|nr:DUF169 domain-containing protein [Lacrimispora sp.]